MSAATLKRRAAQSPNRETVPVEVEKSPNTQRKEFKSIFKQLKNPHFFQEQQDIEIYEGKRPDNFEELLLN